MKYIRYEVIHNNMWARPYLVGIYLNNKGVEVMDWLLGFGSKVTNVEAKKELQRIALMYNTLVHEKNIQT